MMLSRRWTVPSYILLFLGVLGTLVPFVFTFINSIKFFRDIATGALVFTPTLVNYERLFFSRQASFLSNTINSLVIAVVTTVIVLVIATLAAYSLHRFRWPPLFAGIVTGWILVVHMIPGVTLVGPFYLMFRSLGIYDTHLAVILAHVTTTLPLSVWILQSFVVDLPRELEEAALIDGCSHLTAFLWVAVPLLAPGLAAAAILTFIFSWNEFLFALNLTSTHTATIPVGIAKFAQQYEIRYGEMSAAAFFATIPAIIFIAIAQRQIVKGLTLGALK